MISCIRGRSQVTYCLTARRVHSPLSCELLIMLRSLSLSINASDAWILMATIFYRSAPILATLWYCLQFSQPRLCSYVSSSSSFLFLLFPLPTLSTLLRLS
ncbi:hypothetical protein K457DRAFT_1051772 [Linnemannia elongata AG-77]|uniref:Uncharacterized protein n=1 Tax=Linnemannia elongata AG-77 TaxID=1314771 RepID=A0A197JEH6_9FUNG|nr:hypothetical protein K457DRAFT_1051772 [Linnemannia elongata AG-77]